MLVVPYGHDQPDNAFRLTNLGVARTVWPGSYRERRVARELGLLMGDERFHIRAAEVAALVRTEGGAETAVAALESVLPASR
jgi:UDP:flavonoid glycosyltransferase YjiC (YdhE family)